MRIRARNESGRKRTTTREVFRSFLVDCSGVMYIYVCNSCTLKESRKFLMRKNASQPNNAYRRANIRRYRVTEEYLFERADVLGVAGQVCLDRSRHRSDSTCTSLFRVNPFICEYFGNVFFFFFFFSTLVRFN
jgi:hypothetical protein